MVFTTLGPYHFMAESGIQILDVSNIHKLIPLTSKTWSFLALFRKLTNQKKILENSSPRRQDTSHNLPEYAQKTFTTFTKTLKNLLVKIWIFNCSLHSVLLAFRYSILISSIFKVVETESLLKIYRCEKLAFFCQWGKQKIVYLTKCWPTPFCVKQSTAKLKWDCHTF